MSVNVNTEDPPVGHLKAGALGVSSLVFVVIAVTAPLTAIASNIALSIAFGSGTGTVGVVVVVTAVLLVFTAGYVAISRHVINSAAYYVYIEHGLGRRAGAAAAIVATLFYNCAAPAMAVVVGYFGEVFLSTYLHVDVPWWAMTAVALACAWFMVVCSFFAALLSFHSMAARYLFATGREGYLPRILSTTHPVRSTPVVAGTVQALFCAIVIVPFAVTGTDPLTGFLPAIAGLNTLSVVILMTACCISIIAAWTRGRLPASRWAGQVAPAIAGLALTASLYIVIDKYADITGSDSAAVNLMPISIVVAIAYGWLRAHRAGPTRARLTPTGGKIE